MEQNADPCPAWYTALLKALTRSVKQQLHSVVVTKQCMQLGTGWFPSRWHICSNDESSGVPVPTRRAGLQELAVSYHTSGSHRCSPGQQPWADMSGQHMPALVLTGAVME
jgi:hypothetical protein